MNRDTPDSIEMESSAETGERQNLGLPDRFENHMVIGSGGMATVYRCRDRQLDRDVAIKILETSTPESLKRFVNEARVLASLTHPNIVNVLSFDATPCGKPFLVMEFLRGESLSARLARAEKLNRSEFSSIFLQAVNGLQYAAEHGVIHRDIKPSNIFLSVDEKGVLTVKIIDFGIARVQAAEGGPSTTATGVGTLLGSPAYMSPEVGRGDKGTQLSDIYSLGCVMYECLTGRPPFVGETLFETMYLHGCAPIPILRLEGDDSRAAAALAMLVRECLQKSPGDRLSSYDELQRRLKDVSESGLGDAAIVITPPNAVRRRIPFWWMMLPLCFAAIVAIVVFKLHHASEVQSLVLSPQPPTYGESGEHLIMRTRRDIKNHEVQWGRSLAPDERKRVARALCRDCRFLAWELKSRAAPAEVEALLAKSEYWAKLSQEPLFEQIQIHRYAGKFYLLHLKDQREAVRRLDAGLSVARKLGYKDQVGFLSIEKAFALLLEPDLVGAETEFSCGLANLEQCASKPMKFHGVSISGELERILQMNWANSPRLSRRARLVGFDFCVRALEFLTSRGHFSNARRVYERAVSLETAASGDPSTAKSGMFKMAAAKLARLGKILESETVQAPVAGGEREAPLSPDGLR